MARITHLVQQAYFAFEVFYFGICQNMLTFSESKKFKLKWLLMFVLFDNFITYHRNKVRDD